MFTLTLLASPERADLTEAALGDLPADWLASEPRWLAPGQAVEAGLPGVPDDQWEQWQRWQDRGFDLVIQPSQGRRKSVLLADMDSTIIEQECIDELADLAGVGEQVAGITARAMRGELDFAAALHERMSLLAGLPVLVIDTLLAERITLTPGGPELVATMRSRGAYTALVSGGFTRFTGPVADRVGFDEHRANVLEVEGVEGVEQLTGRVVPPVVGAQAKVDALVDITGRLGLQASDVLAVGDGANDLPMLAAAGTGVALHAKPVVAQQCAVRINHGDLTALLYLQGYAAAEIVAP